MNKLSSYTLACLLMATGWLSGNRATAQSWLWAVKAGGSNTTTSPIVNETGNDICSDASGNLYSAGTYSGSMTLGSFSYTSNQSNMWVAKQDANGTFLWAFPSPTTGSSQHVTATGIALDQNGDVIVVGQYVAWQTNITGSGYALEASGNSSSTNGFVMKINGTTGAFMWCTRIWSSNTSSFIEVNGVTTDASGNVYVAGSFMGIAAFSNTTALLSNSGVNGKDAFALKLDGSGSHQWIRRIYDLNYTVGANDHVVGNDIAVDANGDVYLAGLGKCSGFAHTTTLYAASTSPSTNDAFIAKWTNAGVASSVWSYGTASSDGCYGIDLAANGNLVVGGQNNNKAWIASVNPSTGATTYSLTPTGGTGSGVFYDVDTDASSNAYGIGFQNGSSFVYGPTTLSTTTVDNLVAKVSNATSAFVSAATFGGTSTTITNSEYGRGIAVLGTDDYAVTGCFVGTTMTLGSTTLTATGNNDIYTARYGTCSNAAISQHPANASLCTGASAPTLSVTASGTGISYQWQSLSGATWSNVATGGTAATYTPTAAGTYRVTVTGTCGSPVTSNQAVYTVNPLPTAAISGTATVCAGASTTLTASGGTSYSWSSGQTTAAATVSPTNSATYTVTVTNANNCSATASQLVTVNALPSAGITGTTTVCAGASTTLTASGGTSYSWSSGQTTAAATVSPTTSTTYTVTVTNANNCSATASQLVTVNALPSAGITGTTTVCAGTSTTLTASGGTSYSWSSGQNTAAATVSPTTSTTYTVTVTNANNCSATASQLVTVNALPTPAISGTSTVCAGSSTTLTASGGTSYSWSSGQTTATATVSPTTSTTYTVTVTNANTCSATASQLVTVNALPVAAISGNTAVCAGSSITLTASGGTSYSWSSGQNTAAATVSPTTATTYTVTVTNANNCSTTASQAVTVNALPAPAISGTSTICAGTSTTLTATGGGTYSWSSGQNTVTATVSPTTSTTYTVTVTNANNCSATASQLVTVNALPVAAISGNTTLCAGSNTTLTATGGTSYVWNTGTVGATLFLIPPATTTYTVTVTDANNCQNTATATVTVNALPTAAISGTTTICEGDTTTLTATGGTSYSWNNGPTTASIAVNPANSTSYTVTVTNASNCSTTVSQLVSVVGLPNITITGSTSICPGGGTTLTASTFGQNTFLWSNGQTNNHITVFPTVATAYSVTLTNQSGCKNSDTVTVTIHPLPVAAISGPSGVCAGSSATLVASGGTTFVWNDGSTNASLVVSPTTPTTYTVTVMDLNGCTDTASTTIGVVATTTITSPTQQLAVCVGQPISFTVAVSGSGTLTYAWTLDGSPLAATGPTISGTAIAGDAGTYAVSATSDCGTATGVVAVVTVHALPTPAITQAGPSLSTGTFATYQWLLDGQPVSGATSQTFTATQNGSYSVQVTDGNSCAGTSAAVSVTGIRVDAGMIAGVQVYPNPATSLLTFRSDRSLSGTLTTLTGETMLQFSDSNILDISTLPDGVYLLHLRAQDGSEARVRVVKLQ